VDLRERWHDLIPDADELVSDLADRYADRDRRTYRDGYLGAALDAADDLVQLATDPTAVRLAVWFHRAVHTPGATAAEDAAGSARLAAELLPRYGVGATRVAEVERLVGLTDGSAGPDPAEDPNGAVVHDAAMAITAAAPVVYRGHADAVRREVADRTAELHARIRQQLDAGVFRTPLARERLERRAQENLTAELELLDERIPAPWRGWQRAALHAVAVLGAITAAWIAALATRNPWREPFDDLPAGWVTTLLVLAGPVLALVMYRIAGRSDRTARIVAGACAGLALVLLIACLLRMPDVNRANGAGLGVPLMVTAALVFCAATGSALAAVLLRARAGRYVPARNRGQLLAWLGAGVALVLVLGLLVGPLAQRYLLAANEHLTGGGTPGEPAPVSAVDGNVLWSTDLNLGDAVATAHGIAVQDGASGVSMLDGRTGEKRWTYHRTDVRTDRPELYPLDGGARLLVSWDGFGQLVLDTSTGRRVARLGGNDHESVDSADPLITGKSVSKGSNSIRGVDPDGSTRWTYEPGRCLSISAEATGDTVVTFLDSGCSDPDRLVGLDLRAGEELWEQQTSDLPFGPVAAGGLVVVAEGQENGDTLSRLRAIDPRSGNEVWRARAPAGTCSRRPIASTDVLVFDCRSGNRPRYVAVEAATGRTVWQHQPALSSTDRAAVTAAGQLVHRPNSNRGCQVTVAGRNGVRTVEVRDPVITPDNYCRRYVYALGDLVVVDTDEGSVALR
jgi:predicted metal-dependent HD superfamily phosphohydrolase/outer membrane protein assembly factor BamB